MWQAIRSISDVPGDRDLRLAVINGEEAHALVFPCRRHGFGWLDAKTGRLIEVHPGHWQEWITDHALSQHASDR